MISLYHPPRLTSLWNRVLNTVAKACAVSALVVVFLYPLGVNAQAPESTDRVMAKSERIAEGWLAFRAGDYDTVDRQSSEILERWPRDEDGILLRASLLLFGPDVDPGGAGRLLRKLPRSRRSQPDVQALDLWKDYRHGINFMPTVRDEIQYRRAADLLENDPSDPIANLVAGMLRVEDQRRLDNAARMGIGTSIDQLTELLATHARPRINDATGRIEFNLERAGMNDIQLVWQDELMAKASSDAVRHLIRAASSGPLKSIAVRYLTEAAIRGGRVRDGEFLLQEYVAMDSTSVNGHLLLGLLQYMLVKDALAEASFDRALALMSESEQQPWLSPATVVSSLDEEQYAGATAVDVVDYWAREDRLWSREGNRRRVEHLGRMAYADVIWGRPENDVRGWEVEPGQVLIRYGFPEARMQFQTESARFHILHYGHRYWIFEDLVKADRPIFYSPPADTYQGARAVIANDWALIAEERFRDDPNHSELDEDGRLAMVHVASVLEDESGRAVIAAACIRGAGFDRETQFQRIERRYGESEGIELTPVPRMPHAGCPTLISTHRTDDEASQFSLEGQNDMFWTVGRFDIPAATPREGIRVSDLVLANLITESDPGDELPPDAVERRGWFIHPVAEARYDRGQPMHLYVEGYGFEPAPGRQLSIQAIVVEGGVDDVRQSRLGRLFGGRDDVAVSVQFRDDLTTHSHGRHLIIETQDLDPGLYTLAIRFIEGDTGRQNVSRREIRID